MSAMASQNTSVSIVCSTVCSGADRRNHQSSAPMAFVRVLHRWPVDSSHKRPGMRNLSATEWQQMWIYFYISSKKLKVLGLQQVFVSWWLRQLQLTCREVISLPEVQFFKGEYIFQPPICSLRVPNDNMEPPEYFNNLICLDFRYMSRLLAFAHHHCQPLC